MNTDKQSTALQQLIQWLDPIHDSVIKKATELLEVERRQIEDAVNDAWITNEKHGYVPEGEDYFTTTFKQQ